MDHSHPPRDMDKLVSIRIEGISDYVKKEELNSIFREYGEIADIYIPRDRSTGGNRGFCFVRYYNDEDAQKALCENGKDLDGKPMSISIADARPPRREYHRRSYSRSRSRSYHSRRRRHSRSYSRSRSRSSRRHHSHRSHRHSHRSRYDSRSPSRSKSRSYSRHDHKSHTRSRSRSRSLSQDNKLSE